MPAGHNSITRFGGAAKAQLALATCSVGERVALVALALLMLAGCAAGQNATQEEAVGMEDLPMPIIVTSAVFKDGESIPERYSCDGEDISPPLTWSGVPEEAQSMVLIADDPDAPRGIWLHWIVYDMEAGDGALAEDAGQPGASPAGGVQGNNSWRRADYGGPCPPGGTHRYFFTLYALDTRLELDPGKTRLQVEQAMEGHVIGQGQLMGRYTR